MGDQNPPGPSKRMSLEEFKSRHPDPDNIAVACPKCEVATSYGLLENRPQDEVKKWKCPNCNRCNAATAMNKLNKELDVFRWMEGHGGWAGQWYTNASDTLMSLRSLTNSAAASPAVFSNQTNYFEHGSQSRPRVPPSPIVVAARMNPLDLGSPDGGVSSEASDALYMKDNHTPFESPGPDLVGSRGTSRGEYRDTGRPSMPGTSPGISDGVSRGRSLARRRDTGEPSGAGVKDKISGEGVGAAAGPSDDTGSGNNNDRWAPRQSWAIHSSDTSGKYLMSGGKSPGTSPDKNIKENPDRNHVEGGESDGFPGADVEGKTSGAEAKESGGKDSRHSSASHRSPAVFSGEGSEK